MDDPALFDKGKALVKNYGCMNCHEISSLEEEGRIGTELTREGSKPIDRFDFGRLTEEAKRGILPDGKRLKGERDAWYDQKGFVEAKLSNPAVFDTNRDKSHAILKMPKPNVTPAHIRALTTFLLGSVEPTFPPAYMYQAGDQLRDHHE